MRGYIDGYKTISRWRVNLLLMFPWLDWLIG